MKTAAKTVACYVRVSTVGQNEAGQHAEIERWLSGNGIDPSSVRWFVDKGRSGDNLARPAFEQLQAAVFAGQIGTIVTYKLDRLSRSSVMHQRVKRLVYKGLRVVSVTQQIDFNGAVGKMLAAVLLGIAEMEQETHGASVRPSVSPSPSSRGSITGRKVGATRLIRDKAGNVLLDKHGNPKRIDRPALFSFGAKGLSPNEMRLRSACPRNNGLCLSTHVQGKQVTNRP